MQPSEETHVEGLEVVAVIVIAFASVMVTLSTRMQLFASVIVTVYVPAQRLLMVFVEKFPGVQFIESAPVPPEAVTVADPMQTLLH
jgi:hypothetical protein